MVSIWYMTNAQVSSGNLQLAGLDALEKAGFINTDRNKGQGHLIQLTEKGLGYAR
jgi:DNA-binding PadR family transcriptional regulator